MDLNLVGILIKNIIQMKSPQPPLQKKCKKNNRDLVLQDRRMDIKQTVEGRGLSRHEAYKIIIVKLGMKKLSERWAPGSFPCRQTDPNRYRKLFRKFCYHRRNLG